MPPHDAYGQHGANQYYHPPPQVSPQSSTLSDSKTSTSHGPYTPPRYYYYPHGYYVPESNKDEEAREYENYLDHIPITECIANRVQTGHHAGYGPVTYYTGPQTTYDYEARKRGYDALDAFFGQVKRREFDPVSYAAVTRRLFELQGLQLPQIIPSNLNVPAYQPVSAVGGGYDSADPIQSYSLPPMGNAKSREDLTSIDQILEQMQQTIYENDTHLAQSGTPYITINTGRASNSPPSAHPPSMMAHQHNPSISGSTATDASTPGLTPPSSAQSYTSGQSPLPQHNTPSSAMYPLIPTSAADYASLAASAATMGSMYEEDTRRRYGGGNLQRAAPSKSDDGMDIERSDGSVTPPASAINKGKQKGGSPSAGVIDPALGGDASTPKADKEEQAQEEWLQNLRLIEWMRDFIKKQLEAPEESIKEEGKSEHADTIMGEASEESEQRKKDEEALYPVLKHVEQES